MSDQISRKVIANQKATMTSKLLFAEHELANARLLVEDKQREVEQYAGAISMCDALLRTPAEIPAIIPDPFASVADPAKEK